MKKIPYKPQFSFVFKPEDGKTYKAEIPENDVTIILDSNFTHKSELLAEIYNQFSLDYDEYDPEKNTGYRSIYINRKFGHYDEPVIDKEIHFELETVLKTFIPKELKMSELSVGFQQIVHTISYLLSNETPHIVFIDDLGENLWCASQEVLIDNLRNLVDPNTKFIVTTTSPSITINYKTSFYRMYDLIKPL